VVKTETTNNFDKGYASPQGTGTEKSKTFNGQPVNVMSSSTTNTITFNEPNGSYYYTVHLPSGFSGNTKGNITISGQSITLELKAEQSFSSIDMAIIAVLLIIIAVVGAIFAVRRGKK